MAIFVGPNNTIVGAINFLTYTNSLCQGLLGVGMLIIIGFVAFVSTKTYSGDRAFGFAAFLSLISAILLRFLSLINDIILFLVIVIFICAVINLMRERSVEEFAT